MEINSKKVFMEFDQKIAFLVQLSIWAKNGIRQDRFYKDFYIFPLDFTLANNFNSHNDNILSYSTAKATYLFPFGVPNFVPPQAIAMYCLPLIK